MVTLATSQMIAPAGAAKTTARHSTYSVRFDQRGVDRLQHPRRRKGGSSRLKVDTSPFSTDRDSIPYIRKLMMPSIA